MSNPTPNRCGGTGELVGPLAYDGFSGTCPGCAGCREEAPEGDNDDAQAPPVAPCSKASCPWHEDDCAGEDDAPECRGCTGDLAGLLDAVCGSCRREIGAAFVPDGALVHLTAARAILAVLRQTRTGSAYQPGHDALGAALDDLATLIGVDRE